MRRRLELMKAINIPLRILRARERLTWQLELTFTKAMHNRERECKEAGIPYLCEAWNMKSPDKAYDILGKRCTSYHVEHLMLRILISQLQHIVYKATNGEILGHHYNGAVKDIIGNRSIASLII